MFCVEYVNLFGENVCDLNIMFDLLLFLKHKYNVILIFVENAYRYVLFISKQGFYASSIK
jgi:hypothetical protein